MGRKRKTRWRRLSIGEISANEEEEDVEVGGAVIVPSRNQHSPVKQMVDKSSTMTHTNSSSPLENSSSANNMSANGGASNHHNHYHGSNDVTNSSSRSSPNNSHNNGHHSSSSNSSGAASAEPNASYSNNHHHSSHSSHQNGSRGGGGDYYQKEYYHPNNHHSHHHHNNGPHHHYSGGRGDYHHKEYNNSKEYQNGSGNGGGGGGGGGGEGRGGHYSGYHNNYYGSRNSYNNYRNSHYNNGEGGGGGRSSSGGGGGDHYHGNGSDYHYSPSNRSYGGGRYRKPRSYPPSNYYYSNNGSSQDPNGDHTNRPSYNQDEYTKITTPRQDVLFKKGYLSQKKSSSVDSASATTTPSASTNGTPDTQSTNGINSDYSEGYENGETDCVIPYDDTIYYGPPPEAVFTDPNTGQVYYGHCSSNGEYFDAYPVSPVMVAGYPAPVYYHLPYPTVDWNGVPTPMYPVVAAPPPIPIEDPSYSLGLQGVDTITITRDRDTISTTPTPATSYTSTSTTLTCGVKGEETEGVESGEGQSLKSEDKNKAPIEESVCETTTTSAPTTASNTSTTTTVSTPTPTVSSSGKTKAGSSPTATSSTGSSTSGSTSSSSSSCSTNANSSSKTTTVVPARAAVVESAPSVVSSAPISHQYQSKHGHHQYMTPVPYMPGNNLQNQHPHHHPRHHNHHHHHGGPVHHPPPHHAVHHPPPTLALAAGPPPVHPPFHLYPHPAGFVYGHPVYNGVVVPIAPAASAADASNSSLEISPSSRKKRKKRRRKKDGQLTDECSDETCSNPEDCEYDEDQEVSPDINYGYTYYYGSPSIGIAQVCVPNPTVLIPQDNQLEPEPQVTANTLTKDNISDCYSSYCEPNSASSSELVKSKSEEDIAKAKDLLDKESSPPKEESCEEDTVESRDTLCEEAFQMENSEGKGAEENKSADNSNNQEESSDSGNRVEETSEPTMEETVSTANVVPEEEGAVTRVATTSTGKSCSKKPVDLTVQCPPGGSLMNFAELQLLNLQRSPDGNNEPSSPDSLNTNQSVAGSEIAAGETLSVSESDLMNRTTSIDEVEEDLPPEHTNEPEVYCETAYPSVEHQLPATSSTSPNLYSPSSLIAAQEENSSIEVQNDEDVVVEDQVVSANIESSQSTPFTVSVSEVDIFVSEEKEEDVSGDDGPEERVETVEEIPATVSSVPLVEVVDSEELQRPVEEETANSMEVENTVADAQYADEDDRDDPPQPETAERPKSITLAVSEWLKTQGDDVLTPVIPSNSISSEEVDDDIEEEIEGDIEDSDEENDDQSAEAQSQRINELNQKNVHGNPWVAPSNKSEFGSLSKKNRLLNRRSESKGKREHHPLNNKNTNINKGVCQDGVCSRVAHKFSSSIISNTNSVSKVSTPSRADENFYTASTSNAMASTQTINDMKTNKTTILNTSQNLYVSSGSKDEDSGLELSSPESCETNENKDLKKVSRNLRKSEERDLSQINKLTLTLSSDKAEEEAEHSDSLTHENCGEKTPIFSPPVSSALPTPASSIDERNHAESCDPQKFAKYYQFGVVFDKEHDHGIDDTNNIDDCIMEKDIFTFNDSYYEEKQSMSSPTTKSTTTTARPNKPNFVIANTFAPTTTCTGQRQSKTVATQHSQPNEQVILKGYCDENEDEEIGTFDPRKLNRRKNSFKSCNTDADKCQCVDKDNLTTPLSPDSDSSSVLYATNDSKSKRKSFSNCATFPPSTPRKLSSLSTEDDDEEIEEMEDAFATTAYDDFLVQTSVSTSSGHMYVNPMSLAAELVSSSSSTKTPLPDTWDVDSEPLPPYESPPSVDIHVFNQNTPQAKIIRSKFHSAGEPIPCAICCVIQ